MAGKTTVTPEQERTILRLRAKGAKVKEIVTVTQLPQRQVERRIRAFKDMFQELDNVDNYEEHRVQLLSAGELSLLKSIVSQEKIDGAKMGELAKAFHVLHGANRLAKGLSTANVETHRFTEISSPDFNK